MARQQTVEHGVAPSCRRSRPRRPSRGCPRRMAPGAAITATLTRDAFRLLRPPPVARRPSRRIADGARVERRPPRRDACVATKQVVDFVACAAPSTASAILGMAADPSQSQSPRERETMIKRLYGLGLLVVQVHAEERREFRATTLWQGERADAPHAPLAILLKPDERELGELQDAILGAVLFCSPPRTSRRAPAVPGGPRPTSVERGGVLSQTPGRTFKPWVARQGPLTSATFTARRWRPTTPCASGAARSEHMHRVARAGAGRAEASARLPPSSPRGHAGARRRRARSPGRPRARRRARHGRAATSATSSTRPTGCTTSPPRARSSAGVPSACARRRPGTSSRSSPSSTGADARQQRVQRLTHTVFGGLTDAEWDQFHGRVGRRCPPAVGDVFPTRIEGTHVSIKSSTTSAGRSRASRRARRGARAPRRRRRRARAESPRASAG